MKWSYGMTTCKRRLEEGLTARSLSSLNNGGFEDPVLFVDGDGDTGEVHRSKVLGPFGNWVLAVWELYLRNHKADLYAIFQDDLICYCNLKEYIERCGYPERSYLNLYTWPINIKQNMPGWSLSDQMGRGAVALVFDNETLRSLLAHRHFVDHRRNSHNGHKAIDRVISETMKDLNIREFIHNPSLVQHTGIVSSSRNNLGQLESPSFLGESFDALELLNGTSIY